jgi:hypothetical protein
MPEASSQTLSAMSLRGLVRYAHVLAAAADDLSELQAGQAEVDRRLVDAQQDADIASLQDAARRLERRRLLLETGPEGDTGSDRLLGWPYERPVVIRIDDDRGPCMCSLVPPPD